MDTVYSYARLVVGSSFMFWGLQMSLRSQAEASSSFGILLSGIGLAVALHETAYVAARYTRAPQEATR